MGSTDLRSKRLRLVPPASRENEQETIRSAARLLASAVAVITFGTPEDGAAMTAFSVSPLSISPATLLISLDPTFQDYAAFTRATRFAVNVLGADQRELAERFALHANSGKAFGSFDIAPFADDLFCCSGCAAVFECETDETIERRETAIVIASVLRARLGGGSGALVRWRGGYDPLGWSRDEISRAIGLSPSGAGQTGS